jgi:rhodanese-related sulfurtransferase
MNIHGYDNIGDVIRRGTQALSPDAFETAVNETGALVLDTRDPVDFAEGFIPNSINIGLDGQFASWVGTLISDIKQNILFIAEPGHEEEVVTRLARVGYDQAIGYLEGGFESWKNAGKETDSIASISPADLAAEAGKEDFDILDVRRKSEFDSEHIVNAENIPLDYINQNMSAVDKNKTHYVHCAGGYRSMIFISILKARGIDKLVNIQGGFNAIKKSRTFPVTDYVAPTTLL